MENVVIVAAGRTAIGKFGGVFKDKSALDLTIPVIKDLLRRTGKDISQWIITPWPMK